MRRLRARWKRVSSLGVMIVVLLLLFKTYALDEQRPPPATVTNVILVGATGDLAQKYLWQGFFNLLLDIERDSHRVQFIGGTRLAYAEGNEQLTKVLQDHVRCRDDTPDCKGALSTFRDRVRYVQLKTVRQYQDLCDSFNDDSSQEDGRLFYLSVPPFAYPDIVENINTVCRPSGSDTWLRVTLEKPFGSDLKSAQDLSLQLSEHLKEEEIYRIDHYLGKPGVRNILPFRISNQAVMDPVWNHKYIEYVEIAMKEKLDVKGRIGFYDRYGVIRDVMQNHLTEILGLVAMEIPKDVTPASIQQSKIKLFRNVLPATASQTVIGQYESYVDQWMEETSNKAGNVTSTPTFAASALFINNQRWKGVPFIIMSGKKLFEKLTYVKIVFKDTAVCPTSVSWKKDDACEAKQIVFILSQSSSKYPHILISKSFPEPELPDTIYKDGAISSEDFHVFGKSVSEYYLYSSAHVDAYSLLINDCYLGDRTNFVDTDRLTASWIIWSTVLMELRGRKPRIYSPMQSQSGWLNFEVKGRRLEYTIQETIIQDSFQNSFSSIYGTGTSSFRNQPLHRGNAGTVTDDLAKFIYEVAMATVDSRGSFHIAFSGGNSPRLLFSALARDYHEVFPWHKTHIWMVDERCIPRSDPRSNFNGLQEHLLNYIAIPHFNVHPMPTELINGLCVPEDRGPRVYAAEMFRHLAGDSLDLIVLGVGSDGHTASLFPESAALNETFHRVVITPDGPADGVRYRMSVTYYTINNARHVAVLVLGTEKKDIVQLLRNDNDSDYDRYPILQVKPVNGTIEWYVDDEALGAT